MLSRRGFLLVPPAMLAASALARAQQTEPVPVPQPAAPPPAAPQPAAESPSIHRGPFVSPRYNPYVPNPLVAENTFLAMDPDMRPPPSYEDASSARKRPSTTCARRPSASTATSTSASGASRAASTATASPTARSTT